MKPDEKNKTMNEIYRFSQKVKVQMHNLIIAFEGCEWYY